MTGIKWQEFSIIFIQTKELSDNKVYSEQAVHKVDFLKYTFFQVFYVLLTLFRKRGGWECKGLSLPFISL